MFVSTIHYQYYFRIVFQRCCHWMVVFDIQLLLFVLPLAKCKRSPKSQMMLMIVLQTTFCVFCFLPKRVNNDFLVENELFFLILLIILLLLLFLSLTLYFQWLYRVKHKLQKLFPQTIDLVSYQVRRFLFKVCLSSFILSLDVQS